MAYKPSLSGTLAVVVTDRKEAAYWYLKSAEQGDEESIEAIARHYVRGEYIEKDLVQAYVWFSLLQQRMHHNYTYFDAVTEEMSEAQIAEARAIAEEKKKTLPKSKPKISMGVFCLRRILLDLQYSRTCDRYKRMPMDLEEAYFWLKLASLDPNHKNLGSASDVASKLSQEQRLKGNKRAREWKPAEMSTLLTDKELMDKSLETLHEKQDYTEAAKIMKTAAQKGYTPAQEQMGIFLSSESDLGYNSSSADDFISKSLDKINDYIVENSKQPVSKQTLETENNSYQAPYGCPEISVLWSVYYKDTIEDIIERRLEIPGEPQWESCF